MTWGFRLISPPTGVAVHHVNWEAGAEHPTSCGATPFVAEAANVGDLRFLLEKILQDALQNPVLDGASMGLFDAAEHQE